MKSALNSIVADVRMAQSSGIGVYVRNVIQRVGLKFFALYDLKDKLLFDQYGTQFSVSIYTIKEQLYLPFMISESGLFWSPHYNVPILPIRSKRRVVTIHDVYHLAYAHELSIAQKVYSRFLINVAVKLSDRIITVSDFSKSEIIKYCPRASKKIVVIKNGTKQKAELVDFALIKKSYSVPDKYLLVVGNVKPHKNIKKLFEAYLLLDERIQQEYKVVVVGKKDGFVTGHQELFDWIKGDPILQRNTIFTGFVNDNHLDALYHHASIFVFPSLYEGFGLPPLEAMLNGCPVISSSAASMPEVCGEAAMYFDPANADDLKNKITDLLDNQELRDFMIMKGRERAKQFTWEESAKKHEELFLSLLNSN